jgi:hypothetical protein
MSQTVQPTPSDQGASGPAQFDRSMGLVSNFALGFTYLSPLGAITVLLPLGLTTAGPPSIW